MITSGSIASAVDTRFFIIPDSLLAITALASMVTIIIFEPPLFFSRLFLSGLSFATIFILGSLTKKGMGLGDAKFIAISAFSLGFPAIIILLLTACLIAIAFLSFKKMLNPSLHLTRVRLPFAPFMLIGTLISSFLFVIKWLPFSELVSI